jgi:hypothetical protein
LGKEFYSLGGCENRSRWLREPLAIALFDTAHGPEQMVIRSCPKLLRLAVQSLHHQRIENADLLQCRHIAMDAGERCVETVEEIVDERFKSFGALLKSVSAIGRLSRSVCFLHAAYQLPQVPLAALPPNQWRSLASKAQISNASC